jgi:hypothetical protein
MMAATDFVFDIADTLVSFCATASERMTRWILLLCVIISSVLDRKISKILWRKERMKFCVSAFACCVNQKKKKKREKREKTQNRSRSAL